MQATPASAEFLEVVRPADLDERHKDRLSNLEQTFKLRTGRSPDYVVCAPGRVNLIGDHIDYHGFSVLPMAIGNSIWLACAFDPDQQDPSVRPTESDAHLNHLQSPDGHHSVGPNCIELMNVDESTYPSWRCKHSFAYGANLDKSHQWHHYILCGYHGVLAWRKLQVEPNQVLHHAHLMSSNDGLLEEANKSLEALGAFRVLVDSDLPPASGLSSSSALVCASAVAISLLMNLSQAGAPASDQGDQGDQTYCPTIESRALADCCSKCEHLIGTQGGGMDQAVIMTAQEGYAKYVEFVPKLRCENVHLPANTVWLVSHCGVSYPKAATSGFNTRVLETKLGAAMIAKFHSTTTIQIDHTLTLRKVRDELLAHKSHRQIIDHLREEVFEGKNDFSVAEICAKLELTREELVDRFSTSDLFLSDQLGDKLRILDRCEHVFDEAERVERFRSISCTTVDIVLLGQLMTQSHYSLRDKYECSHPALDRLVGVALDAGALGSRLTGAGWGGCIVTFVEANKCDTVLERLREVSKFTFETAPRSGCRLISMSKR